MCGICGFSGPKGWLSQSKSEFFIKNMMESIRHRGDDDNGYYIDNESGVGLGHQRLSIIDIQGGAQPISSRNERAHIVFNGEIYNYKALRKELVKSGYRFKTDSDTEVLLNSYLHWGENCVQHLRGMFSFAIWDSSNGVLFCARDRLGIKPLYYFWDGVHFIFASEIKAILRHPAFKPEQNLEALTSYLRFQYIPQPQTIYKNVKKLPAAHTLVLQNNAVSIGSFWSLDAEHNHAEMNRNDYSDILRSELTQAVNMHMVSDVPLGAFLSGGVDSTIVLALMAHSSDKPIKTHTASFESLGYDESRYAYDAAHYYKSDHLETPVEITVKNDLEKIIYHLDEPFADASAVPTYYLCEAARSRVKVALSGDGGDELFAGYNWYGELDRLNRWGQLVPGSILGLIQLMLGKILPTTFRGATFVKNLNLSPLQQHLNLMTHFNHNELEQLCQFDTSKYAQEEESFQAVYSQGNARDVVRLAQLADIRTYLVEDILMKIDKMSMAHGLEVRVPFLDHRVVELSMNIPTSMKISGDNRKLILKRSMETMVPRKFLKRRKQGFSAPVGKWLGDDLKEMFGDLLLSSNTRSSGLFNQKEVERLWNLSLNNRFHVGLHQKLWTLLCYEVWNSVYS
jgi:asparagine synthase (glutamine-hydrolysing)